MRLGPIPRNRCRHALDLGKLKVRCMFKAGHAGPGGPHEAKYQKKLPYARIGWFDGDARQFMTDKDSEWAWTERGK